MAELVVTLTVFYQQNSRRLTHQFGRGVREVGRVVGIAISSSETGTGNPIRPSCGHESRASGKAGCDANRCVATMAKRWTTSTNTVFIVAKTSGMAVPVARLSIVLISGQNLQFETHT